MRNFNLRACTTNTRTAMEQLPTPYEIALENFNMHVDGLEHHVAFLFKKNKTSIALEQLGYSQEGFLDSVKDVISRIIDFFKNLFTSSPSTTETARIETIKEKTETIAAAVKEDKVDSAELIKLFAENDSLVNLHSTVAVALLYTYDSDVHGGADKILKLVNGLKEVTTGFLAGMSPALDVLDKFGSDPSMTKEQFDTEYGKVEGTAMEELQKELSTMQALFKIEVLSKRLNVPEPEGGSLLSGMRALKKILFTPTEMDKNKMAKQVIEYNLGQPDKMVAHLASITKVLGEIDTGAFSKQLDAVLKRMKISLDKISKKAGNSDTSDNDAFLREFSKNFGEMGTLISVVVIMVTKLVKENNKAAEAVANFIISNSK